jgi:hypothetical protein
MLFVVIRILITCLNFNMILCTVPWLVLLHDSVFGYILSVNENLLLHGRTNIRYCSSETYETYLLEPTHRWSRYQELLSMMRTTGLQEKRLSVYSSSK